MSEILTLDNLQTFPQLSPEAFQRQEDIEATVLAQSVPMFSKVVELIAGGIMEKAAHLYHLSECIRVNSSQAVELYRIFVKAADILSVPELPELFISPEHEVNAYAMGLKRPSVLVTRGLVESMTLPEVMGVLGHELGHVKCGHMVNKTVASMIAQFGVAGIARLIPVLGEAVLLPVTAQLQHWSRLAELSCDRAALLVVQDTRVVANMLAKLGGWPASLGEINLQCLREQGEEYDKMDDDSVAAALKLVNMLQSELYLTHPLPIQRVRRILLWGESQMYKEILAGNYKRLDQAIPSPHCDRCGYQLAPQDRFCPKCGARSETRLLIGGCEHCGWQLSTPPPVYCPHCGKATSNLPVA